LKDSCVHEVVLGVRSSLCKPKVSPHLRQKHLATSLHRRIACDRRGGFVAEDGYSVRFVSTRQVVSNAGTRSQRGAAREVLDSYSAVPDLRAQPF
jgi:hypothetical protein